MATPPALAIHVNGREQTIQTEPDQSLLAVLREKLGLTGTHYGCGEGQCGTCTVLLDGQPVRSCLTRVGSVGALHVTTIEGLAHDDRLHPVQQAFLDADAMQCGYCTPGMILTAVALRRAHPHPTRAETIAAMDGNVCRCGAYTRILRAIDLAAASGRGSR